MLFYIFAENKSHCGGDSSGGA